MKKILILLLLVPSLSWSEKINLKCVTDTYFDVDKGTMETISPTDFTITQKTDSIGGKTTFEFYPGVCKIFIARINQDNIDGVCSLTTSGSFWKEKFVLDRYNGVLRKQFFLDDKYVSYTTSNCVKAEKLF
jgi:hypothetical protein